MAATISFYLLQNISGVANILSGTWIRLTNNNTSNVYVSTGASDANGLITVNTVPAGTYTVATGPSNSGPWTNAGNNNFTVNETDSSGITTVPLILSFTQAAAQIVPGATSISLRNNANNADNVLVADAGQVTLRHPALQIPTTAGGSIAPTSAGSVPIKFGELAGTGASGTISFTGIPAGYRKIVIDITGRSDVAAVNSQINVRFNNDSTAVYEYAYGYFAGNTANTDTLVAATLGTAIIFGYVTGGTAPSNTYSYDQIEIMDYANTSHDKAVLGRFMFINTFALNNEGHGIAFGIWHNAVPAAINRVDIILSAGNFTTGSLITLWLWP